MYDTGLKANGRTKRKEKIKGMKRAYGSEKKNRPLKEIRNLKVT
jgi:hypothetical protein